MKKTEVSTWKNDEKRKTDVFLIAGRERQNAQRLHGKRAHLRSGKYNDHIRQVVLPYKTGHIAIKGKHYHTRRVVVVVVVLPYEASHTTI